MSKNYITYRVYYMASNNQGITWFKTHTDVKAYSISDAYKYCGIWINLVLSIEKV